MQAMDMAEHLVPERDIRVSLHDTDGECSFFDAMAMDMVHDRDIRVSLHDTDTDGESDADGGFFDASNEVCSFSNASEATPLTNPYLVLLKIDHHFTLLRTQDFKTISIPTPLEFLHHMDSTILSGRVLELFISADLEFQQQELSVIIMVPQNLPEANRQSISQACLQIGLHVLHVTSITNCSSAIITRAEEEMKKSGTDMDEADLPHNDDGDLLHRRLPVEEGEWSLNDEEEKAVSDVSVLPSPSKPLFSKVFGLEASSAGKDDDVSIPANYKPSKGSPSYYLQSNPSALRDPIAATARLMVHFMDHGEGKVHYSTGFAVSPNLLMTARHSLNKPKIIEIRACPGRAVFHHNFMAKKAWTGKLKSLPRLGSSKEKDENGLFTNGADVGIAEVTTAKLGKYMLPCSPTFLSSAQRKKVAILSFPAIDGYLKEAKSQLIKGKNVSQPIWKQYIPVMQRIYEKEIGVLAKKKKMSVKKVKTMKQLTDQIDKIVRQRLYDELVNTFGFTHTGTMVCSVGSIICSNKASIGTTCSTLRGSSGAPICPMDRPGDFVGVHHGGACGFDLNSATSCDNDSFVDYYVQEVLPTLPHPMDQCWSSRDMRGFVHWLRLHEATIDKASPWHGVTRRGLKRKP